MARTTGPIKPVKRRGFWALRRQIPAEYRRIDSRREVELTTAIRVTDDPRGVAARVHIERMNIVLESRWQRLAEGRPDSQQAVLEPEARSVASALGYQYAPREQLMKMPVEVLLHRFGTLLLGDNLQDFVKVSAVMGLASPPSPTMLSDLVKEYETVCRTANEKFSLDQWERWRRIRHADLDSFMSVIGGDRPLSELARADTLRFRQHWQERIDRKEIRIATANTSLGRIRAMFKAVAVLQQIDRENVFDNLRFKGGVDGKRSAFSDQVIQDIILAEGGFDGMNAEARCILYALVETGLRPSEVCNLDARTIHLDASIPFVEVTDETRKTKTENSKRKVPLVGVSLMAFQRFPTGFKHRYPPERGNALSALLNKSLKLRGAANERGLSVYSLRHSFESRLTNQLGLNDKYLASMMGHKWPRPEYGHVELRFKYKLLSRICFTPPSRV